MTKSFVILIVEDDEPILEAISIKLQKSGFQTVTARSVDQAISFTESLEQIDAFWIDHYLPEKTGDELVKYLRGQERWKEIPIFLVTNSINPEIVNRYLKLRITQYFTKMLTPLDQIVNSISLYFQAMR